MPPTDPADDASTDAMTHLEATGDPARLVDHPDVSSETTSFEPDEPEDFSHFQEWDGMAVAGVTADDGDVLVVKHTTPGNDHDWVLPHGRVAPGDDWADVAADWVDGLTGVEVALTDVVHVRRNDITLQRDEAPDETTTTTYHVVFAGQPTDDGVIDSDVRYDCDDEWTAGWFDHVPDSARETESQDIALFLD